MSAVCDDDSRRRCAGCHRPILVSARTDSRTIVDCPYCKAVLFVHQCSLCERKERTFESYSEYKRHARSAASCLAATTSVQSETVSTGAPNSAVSTDRAVEEITIPPAMHYAAMQVKYAIFLFQGKQTRKQIHMIRTIFDDASKLYNSALTVPIDLGLPRDVRTSQEMLANWRKELFPESFVKIADIAMFRYLDAVQAAALQLTNGSLRHYSASALAAGAIPAGFLSALNKEPTSPSAIRIPLLLFVDGYAQCRFIGKSLTAVYGLFLSPGTKNKPFDIAHLPSSLDRRVTNEVVDQIAEKATRPFLLRGKLYQIKVVAILGDLIGRIALTEISGVRAHQNSCPTCMACREEMLDYANKQRLTAVPKRALAIDHPLRGHAFPVDLMHLLYLGLVKRFLKLIVQTNEWWLMTSSSKKRRKEIVDTVASIAAYPSSYKLITRPALLGAQSIFTAMNYKIFVGTLNGLARYLKPPYARVWLLLSAFIAAVETKLGTATVSALYWQLCAQCQAAGVEFFPNLHQAMHASYEQDEFGFVSVHDFEAHNKVARAEITASNHWNLSNLLVERAETKLTIKYHFPEVSARFADNPTARPPAAPSKRVYWSLSSARFYTENKPLRHDSDDGLHQMILRKGIISLVEDNTTQINPDRDDPQVVGSWRLGKFYCCAFTPGWQSSTLLHAFLGHLMYGLSVEASSQN